MGTVAGGSHKMESAEWGDGVIPQLAICLAKTQPGLRGFTRPNLFRMRQFYEAYRDQEFVSAAPRQLPPPTGKRAAKSTPKTAPDAGGQIVSALLRQLPWTHHLIIAKLNEVFGSKRQATPRNSSAIPRI